MQDYIEKLNTLAAESPEVFAVELDQRILGESGPPVGREEGSWFDIVESSFDHTAPDSSAQKAYFQWAHNLFDSFCQHWLDDALVPAEKTTSAFYALQLIKHKPAPKWVEDAVRKRIRMFQVDEETFLENCETNPTIHLEDLYLLLQNTRMASIASSYNLMAEWIESPGDDLKKLRFNSLLLQHISKTNFDQINMITTFEFIRHCLAQNNVTIRKVILTPLTMVLCQETNAVSAQILMTRFEAWSKKWFRSPIKPEENMVHNFLFILFSICDEHVEDFDSYEKKILASFHTSLIENSTSDQDIPIIDLKEEGLISPSWNDQFFPNIAPIGLAKSKALGPKRGKRKFYYRRGTFILNNQEPQKHPSNKKRKKYSKKNTPSQTIPISMSAKTYDE